MDISLWKRSKQELFASDDSHQGTNLVVFQDIATCGLNFNKKQINNIQIILVAVFILVFKLWLIRKNYIFVTQEQP